MLAKSPPCGRLVGTSLTSAVLLLLAACHPQSSAQGGDSDGGRSGAGAFDNGGNDELTSKCWTTGGAARCDPRSNLGCDTASGQVCEIGQNAVKAYTLQCFPPPNTRKLGESCDRKSGPYCGPTLHCAVDGVCRHFCCSAADCTNHDQCIPLPGGTFGTIGVCARGPLDAGPDGS